MFRVTLSQVDVAILEELRNRYYPDALPSEIVSIALINLLAEKDKLGRLCEEVAGYELL